MRCPMPVSKARLDAVSPEIRPCPTTAEGRMWGYPQYGIDIYGLTWNKDPLQEAGLDPEKPPRTWDEFRDYAKKLTKKDAQGNITRVGYAIRHVGHPHGIVHKHFWAIYGAGASRRRPARAPRREGQLQQRRWPRGVEARPRHARRRQVHQPELPRTRERPAERSRVHADQRDRVDPRARPEGSAGPQVGAGGAPVRKSGRQADHPARQLDVRRAEDREEPRGGLAAPRVDQHARAGLRDVQEVRGDPALQGQLGRRSHSSRTDTTRR